MCTCILNSSIFFSVLTISSRNRTNRCASTLSWATSRSRSATCVCASDNWVRVSPSCCFSEENSLSNLAGWMKIKSFGLEKNQRQSGSNWTKSTVIQKEEMTWWTGQRKADDFIIANSSLMLTYKDVFEFWWHKALFLAQRCVGCEVLLPEIPKPE